MAATTIAAYGFRMCTPIRIRFTSIASARIGVLGRRQLVATELQLWQAPPRPPRPVVPPRQGLRAEALVPRRMVEDRANEASIVPPASGLAANCRGAGTRVAGIVLG